MAVYYDIATRRKQLGLTLEEVGKRVGVSKSTVKKWETGYIENMKRDKIALLASVLEISPLDLMGVSHEQHEACSTTPLSSAEQKLLANYRLLNKEGQEKLLDNSIDLVSSGRYSKTTKPQILPKETSYKIAAYGADGMEDTQPPIKEKQLD